MSQRVFFVPSAAAAVVVLDDWYVGIVWFQSFVQGSVFASDWNVVIIP